MPRRRDHTLIAVGTHRSGTRSRGISKGPVIAVVAILLLGAAIFGWFQLRDRAADRDSAAAADCVEGEVTLFVTVDPGLEGPVRAIADKYNATAPVVRDHCAQVTVTGRPSADIAAGFRDSGVWNGTLGPQPALWIPDSSRAVESMRVPGLIAGDPLPLAGTPIALGVPEALRAALTEAQVAWGDLPRLQQGSLAEIGLPGWGGLRLALPPGDATLGVAVATGAAIAGEEPLSEAGAATGQVVTAVSGLAAGAPEAADTAAALAAIADAAHGPDSTIHAVAATEQQIARQPGVAVYRPVGTAPTSDHPVAIMSGPWVDQTQNLVAGIFADYLRDSANAGFFTAEGFTAVPPPTGPGATRAALEKVSATLADPVLGVRATALVDVSASMSTPEGVSTRLGTVTGALLSTMNVMPPDYALGIWAFGKNLEGTTPYRVETPTGPLTDSQRSTLTSTLNSLRATDIRADQAYPSLIAAYAAAIEDYTPGRTNSVLLITDGPDDDSSVTGAQLLADLAAAADPDRPVRIDVIVIGGTGTETLQAAAENTGGTYTRLPTTNDISFGTAVVEALTTT
ncbi:von Willebrand factor type A domain-containing protein [Nocardia puris]|uniref:von Willebrand factor type A domain-containing protein n=1 Tax=Nocardia puris TaxID=208602 RepID=A0A366DUM4_9NOCA|nr:von Willebrand factor type A domain-containing protein [Nocardia puris]